MAEKKACFVHAPAAGGPLAGVGIVLWHSAGGDVDDGAIVEIARTFAAAGAFAARARFPYRVAGRKMPDRMPQLIASARATMASLPAATKIFLGGRSMGGRVASMLAAEGFACDGLVFLGYPLHPAGQPEKLRDAHLSDVACPMLFVQGDRDDLCELRLLRPVLARLGARATLQLYAGADHGLRKVPNAELARVVLDWVGVASSRAPA